MAAVQAIKPIRRAYVIRDAAGHQIGRHTVPDLSPAAVLAAREGALTLANAAGYTGPAPTSRRRWCSDRRLDQPSAEPTETLRRRRGQCGVGDPELAQDVPEEHGRPPCAG